MDDPSICADTRPLSEHPPPESPWGVTRPRSGGWRGATPPWAAVAADDPAEVRRLLARVTTLSRAQRRYAEELLQRWEES